MELKADIGKFFLSEPIEINEHISIRIPQVSEVLKIGQNEYMNAVYNLCSVPADLKWQLYDMGIMWNEYDDFECFCDILSKAANPYVTRCIFGEDLDFTKMVKIYDENIKDYVLVQHVYKTKEEPIPISEEKKNKLIMARKPIPTRTTVLKNYIIRIDRLCYETIMVYLRAIHLFERNNEIAGNSMFVELSIELSRQQYEMNKEKAKDGGSTIIDIISYMIAENIGGYNHETIQTLNIYLFFLLYKRSIHVKNVDQIKASGYSGFGINLKKVNKKDLDYLSKV